MWLDMYMRKKLDVKNWNFTDPNDRQRVEVTRAWLWIQWLDCDTITQLTMDAMYWRKANAIHDWFVRNVQDWVDECEEHYVSNEQLKRLMNICKTILDKAILKEGILNNWYTIKDWVKTQNKIEWKFIVNSKEICKYLPTSEWFFFGSTDYDEYYLHNIQETYDWLEKEVNSPLFDKLDFYYQSSW